MSGDGKLDRIGALHSEELSGLEQFKIALKEEYRKKEEELKTISEKDISERLFDSRRETELKISSLREEHLKRYANLFEREKRLALLKVRGEAILEISELYSQVSAKIGAEIEKIRSDRIRYKPVLEKLVMEALDAIGVNAVIKIFPGEASLLPADPRIDSVEEDESGLAWGGCIAEDAGTRSLVVDNSIITRWKQFQRIFKLEFSENFEDVLQRFDRFSRELRIS